MWLLYFAVRQDLQVQALTQKKQQLGLLPCGGFPSFNVNLKLVNRRFTSICFTYIKIKSLSASSPESEDFLPAALSLSEFALWSLFLEELWSSELVLRGLDRWTESNIDLTGGDKRSRNNEARKRRKLKTIIRITVLAVYCLVTNPQGLMAAYFHLGSLSILWLFFNSRIMEKITMFAAVIMILLSYKTMKGKRK